MFLHSISLDSSTKSTSLKSDLMFSLVFRFRPENRQHGLPVVGERGGHASSGPAARGRLPGRGGPAGVRHSSPALPVSWRQSADLRAALPHPAQHYYVFERRPNQWLVS